jgi:hypothetical protein
MKEPVKLNRWWALSIAIASFLVAMVLSSTEVGAHEKATCCSDPCEVTAPCGPSCEIGVCDVTYENWVFYFNGECGGIDSGYDNCARANCFLFVKLGPQEPCNVQCCSDDEALCI